MKIFYAFVGLLLLIMISTLIYQEYFSLYSQKRAECKSQGGTLESVPYPTYSEDGHPVTQCVFTYSDGGKQCRSSNECQGDCLVTSDTIVEGEKVIGGYGVCEGDNYIRGCSKPTMEDAIQYCI